VQRDTKAFGLGEAFKGRTQHSGLRRKHTVEEKNIPTLVRVLEVFELQPGLFTLPNARRQLQAARNRQTGNHARIKGAPTDSCTP
jgi:hypothetical protein